MQGSRDCRFGTACTRPDCYFAHPMGRELDTIAMGMQNMGIQGGMQGGMPPYMYMHQQQQMPPSCGSNSGSIGFVTTCRYSRLCTRQGCKFEHPEGREMDEVLASSETSNIGGDELAQLDILIAKDQGVVVGSDGEEHFKDEWFPSARECTCCTGYVYGCEGKTCLNLGLCVCRASAELNAM